MERIDIAGIAIETEIAGSGPPLLFLHGGDYVAQNRAFLDRLAQRFRVDRAAPSRVRPYAAPGVVPQRARHRLSLSRPARPPRPERHRAGRLVVRRLDRARNGGAVAEPDRPARADRHARGQVRRPRGARHRRHLRPAGRRGAAPHLCRPGARTSPITAALDDREALAIARDREATSLYGWKPYMHDPALVPLAAPDHAARRWCCGARRTASSRPPTASVSPPRCRTHASSGSPRAAHYPQIEQPDAVAAAIERFAQELKPSFARSENPSHRRCPDPRFARMTSEENGNDAGLAFQRDGLSPGLAAARATPTA